MTMLNLVVPGSGTDFIGQGAGFLGELDQPLPALAAYLPGGRNGTPLRDQTGNGRDLAVFGAPVISANYVTCRDNNCLQMPINGDQAAFLSSGAFTFAAVARSAAGQDSMLVSGFDTGVRNSFLAALAGFEAGMANNPAGSQSTLPAVSDRGARWSLYIGTQAATRERVFARRAGSNLDGTATSHAAVAIGGASLLRIGGHYRPQNGFVAPVDIAYAAVFPFEFGPEDASTLYLALAPYFATIGLTL